jgi:hypothetical protein
MAVSLIDLQFTDFQPAFPAHHFHKITSPDIARKFAWGVPSTSEKLAPPKSQGPPLCRFGT